MSVTSSKLGSASVMQQVLSASYNATYTFPKLSILLQVYIHFLSIYKGMPDTPQVDAFLQVHVTRQVCRKHKYPVDHNFDIACT